MAYQLRHPVDSSVLAAGEARHSAQLTSLPQAGTDARSLITQVLVGAGFADDLIDRAAVTASALAARAAEHAHRPLYITVRVGEQLRVEVEGMELAAAVARSDLEFALVQMVADRWGITRDGTQAVLWAEIDPR